MWTREDTCALLEKTFPKVCYCFNLTKSKLDQLLCSALSIIVYIILFQATRFLDICVMSCLILGSSVSQTFETDCLLQFLVFPLILTLSLNISRKSMPAVGRLCHCITCCLVLCFYMNCCVKSLRGCQRSSWCWSDILRQVMLVFLVMMFAEVWKRSFYPNLRPL